MTHCWWLTNPDKQLRLVVFPIIYKVLYIQTVVVWDFFHQQYVVCMLVYKLIQQIQVDPIKVDGAELSSRLTSDCQLVGSPWKRWVVEMVEWCWKVGQREKGQIWETFVDSLGMMRFSISGFCESGTCRTWCKFWTYRHKINWGAFWGEATACHTVWLSWWSLGRLNSLEIIPLRSLPAWMTYWTSCCALEQWHFLASW